jgi:nucleoside-diphosphate-sugar epimerase
MAKQICGWEPRTSLNEGIGKTVEFIRRHPEKFKTTIYNV